MSLLETDKNTFLFIVYRYDSTTGTFTVPPGGDGYYFFSVYLFVQGAKSGYFDVELYEEKICTAGSDVTESAISDVDSASCSAVTYAVEGMRVQIFHKNYGILKFFYKFISKCYNVILPYR